ncbi:MAG: DUF1295 domain-containing protein [Planctomycetes bacterium]|nr:DUF1295 domain-containing protein [Planctomycetota bacterium]
MTLALAAPTAFDPAPLLVVWGASALLQAALWVVAVRTRSANHVDLGWALSLLGAAVGFAVALDGAPAQRLLVAATGGVWAARLSWHLLVDRSLGAPEDGRYAALRARFGPRADRSFFWFFQAQALLAALLAVPFLLVARHDAPAPAPVQWVGVVLFAVAKLGEIVADRQLAAWRREPANRGHTCRRGLWRYSRHPNYFCEWLIWVAFALVATPAPFGAWAWLAPAMMYLFVTRLTGIPHSEAQALRSRGDDYRDYQRTTSRFFPWFPKRSAGAPQPTDPASRSASSPAATR